MKKKEERRAKGWAMGLLVVLLMTAAYGPGALQVASADTGAQRAAPLTDDELARTDLGTAAPSEWYEPPVLRSIQGELKATLNVVYAENVLKIGDQEQKLWLRSYNGSLTGPTLRVKAGDTLFLQLKNDLPAEPKMHMEMDGKCAKPTHGFNTTNLHTHGLHISPKDPSDDVNLVIAPGEKKDYRLAILPAGKPPGSPPVQHYPGTFWYHAHHHGSTSVQLASGMAGALIVEGDVDEVPEIKAARERLFVLQQLSYNDEGRIDGFDDIKNYWGQGERHTIINGRAKPLIRLRPGQVERWRLIDSGIFEDLPIWIRPAKPGGSFKMYQIALDGITLRRPVKDSEVAEVKMAPGYRTDLLVQAPQETGTYYLYKGPSELNLTGGNAPAEDVDDAQILAQLEVAGEPCTGDCAYKIPEALPSPTCPTCMLPDIHEEELTNLNDPEFPRKVDLTFQSPFFRINGKCFDSQVLPTFQRKLGQVEEWEIVNHSSSAHPFHIHVNAFQVLDENGKPGEWRDTIVVPKKKGGLPGKVRFRTRFERFDGRFVLHCHILTHEDEGMMQIVEVAPQ